MTSNKQMFLIDSISDVDEENSDFNQVMNDKSQPIGKEQLLQSPSVTTERQKQPNFNNRSEAKLIKES